MDNISVMPMHFIRNLILLLLIAALLNSSTLSQQSKSKLRFSLNVQSGAFIDVTGNFKGGYIIGGGAGLSTSELLEIYTEFNVNIVKEKLADANVDFNDYSLGTRFYLGKVKQKVKPVIETAIGVYPDFKDRIEYKYYRPGMNLGAGASFNISKNFDILTKAKMHFAIVSMWDSDDPIYVYSGIYVSVKYTF